MIYLFLAPGFEETEAVYTIDLLRRAALPVESVSIIADRTVTGAHGIALLADCLLAEVDLDKAQALVLPGGMPGTNHLWASDHLKTLLLHAAERQVWIAAVCAAPLIPGRLGLLRGAEATCYPSFESELLGATVRQELHTVVSGHTITSTGVQSLLSFGLAIIEQLAGKEKAQEIERQIQVKP